MHTDVPSFARTPRDVLRWRACLDVAEQLFGPAPEGLVVAGTPRARIRPTEAIVGAALVLFHSDISDGEADEGPQRARAGTCDAGPRLRD